MCPFAGNLCCSKSGHGFVKHIRKFLYFYAMWFNCLIVGSKRIEDPGCEDLYGRALTVINRSVNSEVSAM